VPLSSPTSRKKTKLGEEEETESLLRHYLNLSPNLTELYEQWSLVDPNFKKRAPKFTGVRILKQDAWEALVGFICSSNNNIIRISQMVCAGSQALKCLIDCSPAGQQFMPTLWPLNWICW
jgi:N-glycosylase/DNA lyase